MESFSPIIAAALSVDDIKKNAKLIGVALKEQGVDLKHSNLLDISSRGFGYRNFQAAKAIIEDRHRSGEKYAQYFNAPPKELSGPIVIDVDAARENGLGHVVEGMMRTLAEQATIFNTVPTPVNVFMHADDEVFDASIYADFIKEIITKGTLPSFNYRMSFMKIIDDDVLNSVLQKSSDKVAIMVIGTDVVLNPGGHYNKDTLIKFAQLHPLYSVGRLHIVMSDPMDFESEIMFDVKSIFEANSVFFSSGKSLIEYLSTLGKDSFNFSHHHRYLPSDAGTQQSVLSHLISDVTSLIKKPAGRKVFETPNIPFVADVATLLLGYVRTGKSFQMSSWAEALYYQRKPFLFISSLGHISTLGGESGVCEWANEHRIDLGHEMIAGVHAIYAVNEKESDFMAKLYRAIDLAIRNGYHIFLDENDLYWEVMAILLMRGYRNFTATLIMLGSKKEVKVGFELGYFDRVFVGHVNDVKTFTRLGVSPQEHDVYKFKFVEYAGKRWRDEPSDFSV